MAIYIRPDGESGVFCLGGIVGLTQAPVVGSICCKVAFTAAFPACLLALQVTALHAAVIVCVSLPGPEEVSGLVEVRGPPPPLQGGVCPPASDQGSGPLTKSNIPLRPEPR